MPTKDAMLSVYRTLSLRYLSRRWFRALLMVASIALGVGILVATHALNETMARAALAYSNPMAGIVDFVVTNGDLRVPASLVEDFRKVSGVKEVSPRIFENAKLISGNDKHERNVLVLGLDLSNALSNSDLSVNFQVSAETILKFQAAKGLQLLAGSKQFPAIIGKELDKELPKEVTLLQLKTQLEDTQSVTRCGALDAKGPAAALGGFTVILEMSDAAKLLDIPPGEVTRIDVTLHPGADLAATRAELQKVAANRAMVRTPIEQNASLESVMAGMQTGFTLCGVAALVVGLFLVYNSLSVTVAERRHEIGILLALGATREQIRRLFGGEAAILGLAGSILGIPLGILLAQLGLAPVRNILNKIFTTVDVASVEIPFTSMLLALALGTLTAIFASLAPAIQAARANPAASVRRIVKAATCHRLLVQAGVSAALMAAGAVIILYRTEVPYRFGTYGGLMLVLVGALIASPFFAALGARLIAPLVRCYGGIEWRLAADNLVRSPGRTGLVIGALAAGVSLVVQTAGTIRSNRVALRDWVRNSIPADLIVTRGGISGGGGQVQSMQPKLAEEIEALPGVARALPLRVRDIDFRDTKVRLVAIDSAHAVQAEKSRHTQPAEIALYHRLFETPNGVLMSENFAALYKIKVGHVLTLLSNQGEVHLKVVGQLVDYSWNKGTLILNRNDLIANWGDKLVSIFDIYLQSGQDPDSVKEMLSSKLGAQYGLEPLTRHELQAEIDDTIEKLYGIAYAQQVVVMLVAALGVVMALLISVLQRRREMGLLRAIGASRGQVIYSVLAEAALVGIIGTIIGLLVGIPLQWYILEVVILEESGFLFPIHIPWLEGLAIAIAAVVTATIAGYGPALHSVRQRIPEAIAYE